MPIKHKFVSEKADGADATLVQPSDWNEEHDGINEHDHSTTISGGIINHAVLSGVGVNTHEEIDALLASLKVYLQVTFK